MTAHLVKGQNAPLSATEIVLSVEVSAPADLSALLVAENGKVRSDADFIFFNQPAGPGVRLQSRVAGEPANIVIGFDAVPSDVARIRAVVTLEDPHSSFGSWPPPVARITDSSGRVVFEYRVEGLSSESVVIAVEFYRRAGAWKVRAVGQGYAGGFADLVTDHGVSVDDSAPASPGSPAPPSVTFPVPTPAAYPSSGAPPPPRAAAPPQPSAVAQPHANSAEVSLAMGRPVSLVKGQRVSLKKDGGVALSVVRMGLGWDPIKKGFFGNRTPDIDLDASAVFFADRQIVDICYYGQLVSKDGSVRHHGDNLTGEGDGDDEVITVDLRRIPAHVSTVMFIVTSYQGHTFDQLSNAFCRLVDATTNAELARYTLMGPRMRATGMVMAKIFRAGPEWKLQAIGDAMQARHPGEAVPQLAQWL